MSSLFFNVGEIFEIAIQIERNGAAFYRKAASNTANEEARLELLRLAVMEDNHEKIFTELKGQVAASEEDNEWYDPESEAALYLENFAGGQIFDITKDPWELVPPETSLAAVLRVALECEKNSVVFYAGLKHVVPASFDASPIEAIIQEEMVHVVLLSKRLEEL